MDGHIPKVFGCNVNDEAIRADSSSGGFFSLLAEDMFSKNGIVYEVTMSEDCYSARYIRVTTREMLSSLRGSKYLQASIGDTFCKVKSDLDEGRAVLFSGTPCQVKGLKAFLEKDHDNLLCVDLICHGVPSGKLWESYLRYQEGKRKTKVINVNYRCKKNSWGQYDLSCTDEKNKVIYSNKDDDIFMQMFLRNYALRETCYNCIAKASETSDIQMGDFWGVDIVAPELDDDKGSSLVIVRSDKGLATVNRMLERTHYVEISYKQAIERNPAIIQSPERPLLRDCFYQDLDEMDFHSFADKYIHFSWRKKCKLFIKKTPIWNMVRYISRRVV